MAKGAFKLVGKDENFDLKPRNSPDPIPDDQREIHHDVYEARNVLVLLKKRGRFKDDGASFDEFLKRVLQVANAGCTADNVKTRLAAEACDQIRKDIIRRKGMPILWRYLSILAAWALGGAVLGFVLVLVGPSDLRNYGWVLVGAMAGTWISVAVGRWSLDLKDLPELVYVQLEPFVRTILVALVAPAFALLIQLKVLSIGIGEAVNLIDFSGSVSVALLLGLIVGISIRGVSTQVVERLRGLIAPGAWDRR
ncbi:MAG: hypothetical protein KAV87_44665 [Desulfobacteraceae bacterium]|nr:hypothetical protein [Desulfobacteraceae bacterium]